MNSLPFSDFNEPAEGNMAFTTEIPVTVEGMIRGNPITITGVMTIDICDEERYDDCGWCNLSVKLRDHVYNFGGAWLSRRGWTPYTWSEAGRDSEDFLEALGVADDHPNIHLDVLEDIIDMAIPIFNRANNEVFAILEEQVV